MAGTNGMLAVLGEEDRQPTRHRSRPCNNRQRQFIQRGVRVSDRFPKLLVGAHLLQKFVVLIDQRAKRIALCDQEEQEHRDGAPLP